MLARCSFLAAVVPLLACGEPAEPTRFVAAVSDDEGGLSIGLTVHGDLVAAYAAHTLRVAPVELPMVGEG